MISSDILNARVYICPLIRFVRNGIFTNSKSQHSGKIKKRPFADGKDLIHHTPYLFIKAVILSITASTHIIPSYILIVPGTPFILPVPSHDFLFLPTCPIIPTLDLCLFMHRTLAHGPTITTPNIHTHTHIHISILSFIPTSLHPFINTPLRISPNRILNTLLPMELRFALHLIGVFRRFFDFRNGLTHTRPPIRVLIFTRQDRCRRDRIRYPHRLTEPARKSLITHERLVRLVEIGNLALDVSPDPALSCNDLPIFTKDKRIVDVALKVLHKRAKPDHVLNRVSGMKKRLP